MALPQSAVQRRTLSATSGSVAMAWTWSCHRSRKRRASSCGSGLRLMAAEYVMDFEAVVKILI